ncbi:hypothetical protein EDD16DRAFT_1684363, partial [Pisolithus croceorrhizus]
LHWIRHQLRRCTISMANAVHLFVAGNWIHAAPRSLSSRVNPTAPSHEGKNLGEDIRGYRKEKVCVSKKAYEQHPVTHANLNDVRVWIQQLNKHL